VLFTINPVSGNGGEIVVNARLGSGEALVSGRCTPESLILDRATLRVLRRDASPDGKCRALDDARARDLGRLALRAETTLGGPLDIEWAFDAEDPDRIALLQARPITAAAPGGPAAGRPLPGGRGASVRGPATGFSLVPRRRMDPTRWVWTNANVGEALPGVATPFTWSVAMRFSRLGFERAFATLGCSVPPDAVLVDRFHGRIYLNATEFLRIASQVPLLTPRHIERLAGVPGLGELEAEANLWENAAFVVRLPATLLRLARANLGLDSTLDDYERRLASERARLAALDLAVLDGTTLLSELERREQWLDETGSLMLTCASNSLSSFVALGGMLRLWLPAEADRLVGGLMAGFADLESAAPGLALWHISELVRLDGPARTLIEGRAPERLRLEHFDAGSPTRRALDAFLRAYGFRAVREAELSTPRWSEDPTFLFATLRSYVASEVGAPIARVERQKEARRRAAEEVERGLSPARFTLVRHALRLAQKYTRLRERMRSRVTEVLGWYRAFALEAGRRLGDPGGALFLELDQVRSFLRGELPDAVAVIAEHREQFAADVARPDPPTVFVGSPPPAIPLAVNGAELRGVGASPGRAEGRARVLRDPAEAAQLRQGEVLVVPHADVGWSPLFLVASAVVTGMGGMLSHAAVVAREYGVPAVFGVPAVTSRVRTGDRVTVDGGAGIVTVERSTS
jgi:pyruvate,water dikinase